MPRESLWKGLSMRDMPAGLEPKPGAEDCAHPWAQHWCRLPQEAFLDAQLASVMTQKLLVPGLPLPGGHVGVRGLEGTCV